jgi:hypothetical protein
MFAIIDNDLVLRDPSCRDAMQLTMDRSAEMEEQRHQFLSDLPPPPVLKLEERKLSTNMSNSDFNSTIKRIEDQPLLTQWKPDFSNLVSSWRKDSLVRLESSTYPACDIMATPTVDFNRLVDDILEEFSNHRIKRSTGPVLVDAIENLHRTLRSFPHVEPAYTFYVPKAEPRPNTRRITPTATNTRTTPTATKASGREDNESPSGWATRSKPQPTYNKQHRRGGKGATSSSVSRSGGTQRNKDKGGKSSNKSNNVEEEKSWFKWWKR